MEEIKRILGEKEVIRRRDGRASAGRKSRFESENNRVLGDLKDVSDSTSQYGTMTTNFMKMEPFD